MAKIPNGHRGLNGKMHIDPQNPEKKKKFGLSAHGSEVTRQVVAIAPPCG